MCITNRHGHPVFLAIDLTKAWDIVDNEYIHAMQTSMPSRDKRNEFLHGVFEPDERYKALYDRLKEYYDRTKYCTNSFAHIEWKKFRYWADERSYTSHEINRMKRAVENE